MADQADLKLRIQQYQQELEALLPEDIYQEESAEKNAVYLQLTTVANFLDNFLYEDMALEVLRERLRQALERGQAAGLDPNFLQRYQTRFNQIFDELSQ